MKIDARTVGIGSWALVLLVVAVLVARPGKGGKLYPTFAAAGQQFWTGAPLYGAVPADRDQFRYSPLAAALFGPWHLLPLPVGQVVWRWAQAIGFLVALRAWAKISVPPVSWPHLALLTLPLCAGNVFNGQVNLLVGALLLGSVVTLHRERYTWAALLLTLATALKVYPLAFGLLFVIVAPRPFVWRWFACLALAFLLPYAVQSRTYVDAQFHDWWQRVGADDRTDQPMHKGYHDLQKLLRCWGAPLTLRAYRGLQLVVAAGLAAVLWWQRRRGCSRLACLHSAFVLGSLWCTLCGPATESATYMLLAVPAGHALLVVHQQPAPRGERVLVSMAFVLLLSGPVALWFPHAIADPYRALTPQAHGALLLLCGVGWRAVRESIK